MKTEELRALFAKLPETECLALDETVMDQGICTFDGLLKTMELVTTYFKEQPSAKLTFKEFQATRKAVTWDQARCQAAGLDGESAEMLMYEDCCYIECRPDGMYQLQIGNQDWFDPRLEVLEQLLYDLCYI